MTNHELPQEDDEQKDKTPTPEGEELAVPTASEVVTEKPEVKEEASIPLMITRKMKEDLYSKGYSDEQIDKLTPQQAHEILSRQAVEVTEKILEKKEGDYAKFENPEYDFVKQSYDPLHKLMEELKV
ncbi:MAG: hypothetical protein UV57_C0016G0001, partial [Parcubacteria group bacterium GW2011_GWD2_43_10]